MIGERSAGGAGAALPVSHVLGRWVTMAVDLDRSIAALPVEGVTGGPLGPDDVARMRAQGPEGAEHAGIVEGADLAVGLRDAAGDVLQFACLALSDVLWPDIGEHIRVRPGEAFIYHQHTLRHARGRGLAAAGLDLVLRMAADHGARVATAHVSRENAIARHYAAKAGFLETGEVSLVLSGGELHWITVAPFSFFVDPALVAAPGVEVHRAELTEWRTMARDLAEVADRLADEGATLALFGSGLAAGQLLALVPSLAPLVVGVVDNDEQLRGRPSPVLPHLEVGAPAEWAASGASHLLYTSRAHQGAMQAEHRAFGPPGTTGIQVHPSVATETV